MFPFQWNSRNWPAQPPQQLDLSWNPMLPTTPMATPMVQFPQGQFCGNDSMNQQQSQAQIQALNQQNALLNQQIQTQYMTHLHHLQQLASHTTPSSSQQPTSASTPPVHPAPHSSSHGEPCPPGPSQPAASSGQGFNTEEIHAASSEANIPRGFCSCGRYDH